MSDGSSDLSPSHKERTVRAHLTSLAASVLRRLLFDRAMTTARICLRGAGVALPTPLRPFLASHALPKLALKNIGDGNQRYRLVGGSFE